MTNTIEVTDISQCVKFTSSPEIYLRYEIGKSNNILHVVNIKNLTTNLNLSVSFTSPSFLNSSKSSTFILYPGEQQDVIFTINEAKIKELVLSSRNWEDIIHWNINPMNVSGPIYIA